jgi:ferritin-like protein
MANLRAVSEADKQNDIKILNRALFFEHRGVWAYGAAGGKLSNSEVGRAVRAIGEENRADHQKHQALLRTAITDLGGAPTPVEDSYDLSSFIQKGYGNLDSDVNIAKLALALEIGAAAGYVTDATHLKSPEMIEMEAGIACVEAIHVGRIRLAFNELGIKLPVVPNPLLNASSRDEWVIKI